MSDCSSCPTPDIYLLVTDGYGGSEQLKKLFDFDNAEMEQYLKWKGFYIIDSSFSNYSASVKSMTSMLNMDYIKSSTSFQAHEMTNQTVFPDFLSSIGYEIKNYSPFKIDGKFPLWPIHYFPVGSRLITGHTFISRLNRDIRGPLANFLNIKSEIDRLEKLKKKQAADAYGRDSLVMDKLLKEADIKQEQPRFVYAHFLMPHPPYLYDSAGRIFKTDSLDSKSRYIEYLKYTNSKLRMAVAFILQRSVRPPIIVLMSDHGYRNDSAKEMDPLRFLNIISIYTPDGRYEGYYKGMSNVNMFRSLLNQRFGQKLPPLKDSFVY
jgi:hypothetical protein